MTGQKRSEMWWQPSRVPGAPLQEQMGITERGHRATQISRQGGLIRGQDGSVQLQALLQFHQRHLLRQRMRQGHEAEATEVVVVAEVGIDSR